MYDNYILASYLATFIPLLLLAAASWRAYGRARRDVAAFDEAQSDE